jgi:hypothetical protein
MVLRKDKVEIRYPWDLLVISVTAFCYLAARAWIPSVTIDEASVFLTYATGSLSAGWSPTAANHVLNTLLERLSWSIFGFNQVAMRVPALLGAVIYLGSAASICARLPGRPFRMLVFLAVVFNPFVLDYLVVARGYSLAVGLLLGAVAVFWRVLDRERGTGLNGRCVLASILLALSVAISRMRFQFVFWLVLVCVIVTGVPEIAQMRFSPSSRIVILALFALSLLGSRNFRWAEKDLRGPARPYWKTV